MIWDNDFDYLRAIFFSFRTFFNILHPMAAVFYMLCYMSSRGLSSRFYHDTSIPIRTSRVLVGYNSELCSQQPLSFDFLCSLSVDHHQHQSKVNTLCTVLNELIIINYQGFDCDGLVAYYYEQTLFISLLFTTKTYYSTLLWLLLLLLSNGDNV